MNKVFLVHRVLLGKTSSTDYYLFSDKHIEYSSGTGGESVKLGDTHWVSNIGAATLFDLDEANEFLEAIISLNTDLQKGNLFRLEEWQQPL
jgi:hypothetical protein